MSTTSSRRPVAEQLQQQPAGSSASSSSTPSIRNHITMPRPTTGAYFMRVQQQHDLAHERKHEVVRKDEMTEEELKARQDMVRVEEALKIANRAFREEERRLKEEKAEREAELRRALGDAKAVRVEVPMEEETARGGIREMYIVKQIKRVVKENTLGRLELFALACSQAQKHPELQETYDAVFEQIQNDHHLATHKPSTKRRRA